MGMTIDESIEVIKHEKPEKPTSMYGIMKKNAFNTAIETMRKYQKMQEVLEKVWNVPSCMLDEAECLNEIMETYRTVR